MIKSYSCQHICRLLSFRRNEGQPQNSTKFDGELFLRFWWRLCGKWSFADSNAVGQTLSEAICSRLEVLKKMCKCPRNTHFWCGEAFLSSDIASRENRLDVKLSQQWNHLGSSQKVNTKYCRSTTCSRFCPHLKNNRKNTLKVLPRAMASASKTGEGWKICHFFFLS